MQNITKPKVLIISPSEICYNPRLFKAGDYWYSKGFEIVIYNSIINSEYKEIYESFKNSRKWTFIENDISKIDFKSTLNWFIISIIHKILNTLWEKLHITVFGYNSILNKGLIFNNLKNYNYDIIIINLVDTLPLASKLKMQNNKTKLIYDSQEYFLGQYQRFKKSKLEWVKETESKYISKADLILATTNVMCSKIKETHHPKSPLIRVRNLPNKKTLSFDKKNVSSTLNIIWHGIAIKYKSIRGLHIIIDAVLNCKTDVKLYIQGRITESERVIINNEINYNKNKNRIEIVPPAHPEKIVESIIKYDVGVVGELPMEENQKLTSSNKLFEFIAAGLCTIVPDVIGLTETISEYNTGVIYQPGNSQELSDILDNLNKDRNKLNEYKSNSRLSFKKTTYWEKDYEEVYNWYLNEHV